MANGGGDVGALRPGDIPTGFPGGAARVRVGRRGTSPTDVIDQIAQGRAKGTDEIHYSENAAEKQLAKISAKIKAKRGPITRLIDRWKSMPRETRWLSAALAVVGVGLMAGAGITFAAGMVTVGPLGWTALAGLACVGLAAIMGKVYGKSPSAREETTLLDREIKLHDLQKDIKKMDNKSAEAAFNSYVDSLRAKPEQIGEHYLQQQVISFLKAEQTRAQSKSGADKGYDFRDAFCAVSSFWDNRRRIPDIEAELHEGVSEVFEGIYRDNPDFVDPRTGRPLEKDATSKHYYADYGHKRLYFEPKHGQPVNFDAHSGQLYDVEWSADDKKFFPKGSLKEIGGKRICDMTPHESGMFTFMPRESEDPFDTSVLVIVNPRTGEILNEKPDDKYVAMAWNAEAGDAGEWETPA